ncbi:uncharacterized protein PAN0_008c3545 [Moesziomyces antarcticus]|uniref:Uncharacterized protein n=2 Tax=Pseudozyma antarctica TaxID=84753 RepID=A0A5C3FPG8_PSEA2|nr:uncharacterized protein PAN0_008c3545 [Moesziomyces antarcticus]GAK65328.1 conserved hypothetical protein [Moesziomyces antarcticus]SPO46333.1 uncharacterized protein PSANT_04019 [Moesziomyces antarcticus]
MPRRKIGADLKEALCKLYEAGDISADTIEKHGIMSRATFFRNLKMYKSGASLEQRHSTGRKTNADKLKEQEKLELDALRPLHLSHLELVLLLDEDDKGLQEGSARNKRKAKGTATSSKRRDLGKSAAGEATRSEGLAMRDESGSESDVDSDDAATLAKHQALAKLRQAARSFLAADGVASSSRGVDQSTMDDRSGINDLDSLLKPEDSHYSHVNRGALFIVKPKGEVREDGPTGGIIAAIALRSLIWTPEIYQALGPSYAGRSIDRICNLVHLRVDARWQRQGIGRWLVNVAGLKAAKLGFSHLYTQSASGRAELLSFWQRTGFTEFARFDDIARFEQVATAATVPANAQSEPTKPARRATHATSASSSSAPPRRTIAYANDHAAARQSSPQRQMPGQTGPDAVQVNQLTAELDLPIPLDPSISSNSVDQSLLAGAERAEPIATSVPYAAPASAAARAGDPTDTASQSVKMASTATAAGSAMPSNEPPRAVVGPPPRRIAFHEAADVESGRPRH